MDDESTRLIPVDTSTGKEPSKQTGIFHTIDILLKSPITPKLPNLLKFPEFTSDTKSQVEVGCYFRGATGSGVSRPFRVSRRPVRARRLDAIDLRQERSKLSRGLRWRPRPPARLRRKLVDSRPDEERTARFVASGRPLRGSLSGWLDPTPRGGLTHD